MSSAAGSIAVNQMAKRRTTDQFIQRQQEAEAAEAKLSPFTVFRNLTGRTALEKAEADRLQWLSLRKKSKAGKLALALSAVLTTAAIAIFALQLLPLLPGLGLLLLPAAAATAGALLLRAGNRAEALAAGYNAAAEEDFSAYAQEYDTLYKEWARQKEAETEIKSRLDGLTAAIDGSIAQLLADVQAFSPEVTDLNSAVAAIDRAVTRTEHLEAALQEWEQLRIRCETLESTLSDQRSFPKEDSAPLPEIPYEELEDRHTRISTQLEMTRHRLAHIQGQLQSAGDLMELIARKQELQKQLDDGNAEYNAIAIAMAELENANTDLQNRFSPALGAEAAKIFARLTGGKYHKVLLDRDLSAQIEAQGDALPHPAIQLSCGAMDQLYLAVRLAICRMVLPADKPAPLVLDDALSNFDDERMALALEVLREEAKTRQILLFTCQERELRWAEGKPDIHCIRLSQA